jgi:beta-lactamase class A
VKLFDRLAHVRSWVAGRGWPELRPLVFQPFSNLERAITVAGVGPALLMGCSVHNSTRAMVVLPAANAQVAGGQDAAPVVPAYVPPAPRALVNQLDALVAGFSGTVGIAVTSVDEGWTAQSRGELKLPQQSVSKLWVAMTVLDKRDQGLLTLDDQITLTESDFTLFHQPIAYLVAKDGSYTASIGELMRRALQMSDNTCNDKLLRLVGGPAAVREYIARKGLGQIRFGPGERDLQSLTAGLSWKPEYSKGNAFAVARSRLDPSVRLAAFESYVSDPPDGAAPVAIASALARLKKGELLSPSSTAWLIVTMEAARTGKARVRGAVPLGWSYGHKTGTGQDLKGRTAGFNDVGLLTAPDGKSYAVAVMIGDTPRPVRERQLLMQAVAGAIVANHR